MFCDIESIHLTVHIQSIQYTEFHTLTKRPKKKNPDRNGVLDFLTIKMEMSNI